MRGPSFAAILWFCTTCFAQSIQFESGGLVYQAQTRGGVTVMVAPLQSHILGYSIVQVAISNGSTDAHKIVPEKFRFERDSGQAIQALSARAVVTDVLNRAGRDDIGKLFGIYEAALFGSQNLQLRHGYETRRKDAMGIGGGGKARAAAAAASIVLGTSTLEAGATVDGAVFVPTQNKPLGAGKLIFDAAAQHFEFTVVPAPVPAK
jgi:hypothetical protein